MEIKKHFKMYKSGKLWNYAAIATVSLAMGMAVVTNNAKAATNSTVQPVALTQVTTQSQASTAAAVNTVAVNAAAQPGQQNSAESTAANNSQQPASSATSDHPANSNSQGTPASAETRNVTLTITYQYNDDSHPASSSPQTATYTKQANGKWTTEKGWSDVKVTPPEGYAAQMVGNGTTKMLTSGQNIPIDVPSADDPQSQSIVINYLKLQQTLNITRTIKMIAPDGKEVKQPTPQETVSLERDLDTATGEYGDWKVTKGAWTVFQPSALDGYAIEIEANGQILKNKDGSLATVVPAQSSFKSNHPSDETVTVNYRQFTPNASQTKTITRTIVITEPNGQRQTLTTQQVKLQLLEATDSKGKVIASHWTTGQWAAYDLPALNGYVIQQVSDKTVITTVSATKVTSDTKNTVVNLAYVPDKYNQNINKNLKGNWAWLDYIDIENNALHVIGWNANSYSQGRGYHYLIVLADGHEVGRVLVKQVIRQDVKDHYKVWNAATSGFDELIPLNLAEMNPGAKLTLISRWTSDKDGNNNDADWYFSPYTPNYNQNVAYLDNFVIDNNSIHVTGWNATADSINRAHWLILYDATLGRELSRQLVDPVARPDVLKAYPSILNADKSGFDTYFDISRKGIPQGIHLSHNLLIVSRYSDDLVNGEGNRVDYWFPAKQFFNMHAENRACLDSVNIVNGRVHVTGWHATDLSQAAANRFLILHDDTRGQDVTYAKVNRNVSRPDVATAFPSIKTAGDSGFDVTFNQVMLTPGDHYSLISRYSTSGDGNGGLGAKADYRMTIPNLFNINTTNAGNLDSITVTNGDTVTVTGWHATDYSLLANNRYLILFDTTANRQVAQTEISSVARPDVARAYRYLQTAGNSGFNATFDHVQLQNGHTYALVSRYSISPNGNGDDGNANHHIDYWFNNALKINNRDYHDYWIDSLKPDQQNNSIDVTGWMISDASQTMPHAYLILLNGSQEIGRVNITLGNRSDVQTAFPQVYNSDQSGIDTSIKLNSGVDMTKLANRPLQLVLRFTSSDDGNSNYDDQKYNFTFNKSQVDSKKQIKDA